MSQERVFIALGTDRADPATVFASALHALQAQGAAVVHASRVLTGPHLDEQGRPKPGQPDLHNAVAEIRWPGAPRALLDLALAIERQYGRTRGPGGNRQLDLDILAFGHRQVSVGPLVLPHPRATRRAFVLAPWEEIAPEFRLAGPQSSPGTSVLEHAARWRCLAAQQFLALAASAAPELPARATATRCLTDGEALRDWRSQCAGSVGVVPTMGALHAGHAALVRRAAAECDSVLVTLFVNPLQFGVGEDLGRYPRTLEADLALLGAAGAGAVYLPNTQDLYPEGFGTYVVPEGMDAFEGAVRPGHFRGVATVVAKLLLRTQPTRAYFGQKDAQQLAMIRRLVRDLDLPGEVVPCATVRDADGLALSSRNRYLEPAQRVRAQALPQALEELASAAASGEADAHRLCAGATRRLEEAGLTVDYVALVDALTFEPVGRLDRAVLAVAAARAGSTRLLDNRWIAPGAPVPKVGAR